MFWKLKRIKKNTLNIKQYSGEFKKDYEKAKNVNGMTVDFFLNTKGVHEGTHAKQGRTSRKFSESEAVRAENKSANEYKRRK